MDNKLGDTLKANGEFFENKEDKEIASIKEIIYPTNLPGIAFQSYEKLDNNFDELKSGFFNDEFRNPSLDYYSFNDASDMDEQITSLYEAYEKISLSGVSSDVLDAVRTTLEYRASEMSYIRLLAVLDKRVKSGDLDGIDELINGIRWLNETLYGRTEQNNFDGVLNRIWGTIDSKEYGEQGKKVYDELKNGFYWNDSFIPGLPTPSNPSEQLPDFNEDGTLPWIGEYVESKNADIRTLINELWDQRKEEFGADWVCPPQDIKKIFEDVLSMRDPEGKSGIRILIDENAKLLSWNSHEMAVIIGGKHIPVKTSDKIFGLVMHEFGVHGQRAINGLNTELPVLGTGLFTNTSRADYLTFEEGFATLVRESVKDSEKDAEWDPSNFGIYLNIALAEQGRDFREVFELSWRYRILMKTKPGEDASQDLIEKQKSFAFSTILRVFRGNPIDINEKTGLNIKPMTYNKDLDYLKGRVVALDYLKKIFKNKDITEFDRLFKAKFDPTIPEQSDLVDRFCK